MNFLNICFEHSHSQAANLESKIPWKLASLACSKLSLTDSLVYNLNIKKSFMDNVPDSLALWIGRVEKGVLWFSGNCCLGVRGVTIFSDPLVSNIYHTLSYHYI